MEPGEFAQTDGMAEDGPPPLVNLELPPHSYVSQSLDIDFRETSFFSKKGMELPSPLEVYARQGEWAGERIAMFEELNLVVKLGIPQDGRLEEALTMQALRKAFPGGEVPVPEVFGCRTHNRTHFIYMSLIPGISLSKAWDELNADDKVSICNQLGGIQSHLMSLWQGSSEEFVGSITRGPLHDRFFRDHPLLMANSGPFDSVKSFNDFFQYAMLPRIPLADRQFEDPCRHLLSDDCAIRFCHGDLHFGNVMISDDPSQPRTVTGVIDWEEAGWLPEYWEYCKMRLVICQETKFYDDVVGSGGLIDRILPERHEDELEAVAQYWHWRGCCTVLHWKIMFLNIACFIGSALAVASSATRSPDSYSDAHFDYVILGGGTAGMVIANRLSENPNNTVLVVEAGTFQYDNPLVTNTTVLGIARNTDVDWQYESAPQIYAANQTIAWSAGKGLGGSSLINGMTHIRPASSQMDLWPSLGLDLDWNKLFAYGKKYERYTIPPPSIQALGGRYVAAYHGFDGPLDTCISKHMSSSDIHTVFNDTMKNVGIPPIADFDGGELRGFGCQAVTQDSALDVREDAARAYYYPVQDRENLHVMVNTTAARIIWSENNEDGKAVALGASVVRQDGQISTIYADREVILSAGAIRSPAILEYSGVGNPSVLSKYNISTTIDLPAVGENFQDQTVLRVTANFISRNETGFPNFVSFTSLQDIFGDNTTSVYDTAIAQLPAYAEQIAAQNGGASSASAQHRLLKSQLDLLYDSNTPTSEVIPLAVGNLVGVVFWPLQPLSRGSVHIISENDTTPPSINPNFFQSEFDGLAAVQTARFSRRVLTTAPLSDLVDPASISPSFEEIPEDAGDELWLNWLKNSSFGPNHHHLGSCAMLPRDMGGVVDNNFTVYGTSNVRVIDLSVIPLQVAGHSTALLYAVAEWAATKFT
ncbi:hypothetical protein KVR01_007459 [Diaporthe batatas]|uniref:uncharacterized protein n=1 Tax=Diaporthe batatas TaxID=748121 RepID=UPI001D03D93A|nr:uncharacterized protein KVR01_007459 [Diaporthe batatas]KAG8162981.1 hypothetical protein KVR01_007459 [Diaporthe batatas]